MKKLVLLLILIPIFYFSYEYFFEKSILKTTEFKEGRWINTVDSLSGIEIKNGKWIMFYKGETNESISIYDFKIRAEKNMSDTNKYLTIFNESDTLEYFIIEYNNQLLSLSYLGRGNTLNYQPEKTAPANEFGHQPEKESFLKTNNINWKTTFFRII